MGEEIKKLGQNILGMLPGIAGTVASGFLGAAFGKSNDQRQYEQQQKLQDLQEKGNMRMMDYSMNKQYEMWLKTNYSAQIEQMKKAGLNPALLYGTSGGGATTTGSPSGGVSGASGPQGGGEAIAFMGIAQQQAQLKLIESQNKLLEAQANKTNIEATNIGKNGIDTKVKENQISKMIAETTNTEAQTKLTKAQTFFQNIQNYIGLNTAGFNIDKAMWEADQAEQLLLQARQHTYINSQTINETIQTIKQNLTAAVLDNQIRELNKKQIKATTANIKADTNLKNIGYVKTEQEIKKLVSETFLTDAKTKETLNNIALNWANWDINNKRLAAETIMNKLQSIYAHENLGPVELQSHDINQVIKELDKIYKTENFSNRPNWENFKIPY